MSTSYKIAGIVRVITETKQVSAKFSKRELVLDVEDGKYPQVVCLEVSNDRCSLLDGFQVGQEVSAEFNVRGREWKSPSGEIKYFTTLAAWKVEIIGTPMSTAPAQTSTPSSAAPPPAVDPLDDCPF